MSITQISTSTIIMPDVLNGVLNSRNASTDSLQVLYHRNIKEQKHCS